MKKLLGLGIALITPFNKQGKIDFTSLENLVSYVIDGGVKYLVLLGTTGEACTLQLKEKIEIINCVKNVNNDRLPLVLGIGSNNTKKVISNLNRINLDRISAILSVCPYYNKPTQKGIYNHFKKISENTDKNIIIYNVPHRTGCNINIETINKLMKKKNIIGIKEASGNMIQSYNFIKKKNKKKFIILSGDDNLVLPLILGGGDGIISVIGQAFPKEFSKMILLIKKKKINYAYKIYYNLIKIISLIFKEGNPSGIKTLLKLKGLCNEYVRLPLFKSSQNLEKKLFLELKKVNLFN